MYPAAVISQSLSRPSPRSWKKIVEWFAEHSEECREGSNALKDVGAQLDTWPRKILRPIPYAWIIHYNRSEDFSVARLGNAISLGDRWSSVREIGLGKFRPQSVSSYLSNLPRLRYLDLALQDKDGPYAPGMLIDAGYGSMDKLVAPDRFPRLRALDVSGVGVGVRVLEQRLPKRGLRTLIVRNIENAGSLLENLAQSPALGSLRHLDVQYNNIHESKLLAFLKSPHLKNLRVLKGFGDHDNDVLAVGCRAAVEASSLPDATKEKLLAGVKGARSPFDRKSFPGLVGGQLPPIDEEESDDDEEDYD